MAVPYERYTDDSIEVAPEDQSSDSEDEAHRRRLQRIHFLTAHNTWPKSTGVWQMALGFLLVVIGLFLGFWPLITRPGTNPDFFSQTNWFGVALWGGTMLVLSGSLGVRSSLYQSVTTLYAFFTVILLNVVLFTVVVAFVLLTSTLGWIKLDDDTVQFSLQIVLVCLLGLSYIVLISAFTRYYEDVFCGELQLCKRTVHCCCPCLCPRPVSQQELLEEDSTTRPPSLPV